MYKEEPLISVIIPIYNVQKYLHQCISSVCSQTYKKLQIILVDDGSTDESSLICDIFADKDNRIEVIHKRNNGLVSARKIGTEHAVGEYVSFVDGDDWIDENTYEKIVASVCRDKPDIIAFGCIEEYGFYRNYKKNAVKPGLYKGQCLERLKSHILMTKKFFEWTILPHLCDKLISKALLSKCINEIPDTVSFAEDAVCSFPCMLKADTIMSLDFTPYHYRQREGSIVKEKGELEEERFKEIYKILKKEFNSKYNSTNQLKYYLFFLLLLKGYSKLNEGKVLFPFDRVTVGDRIFVYGAGGFGRVVKNYIENTDNIYLCGWTDKRADYYIEQGMNLDRYEVALDGNYDRLIISILDEDICKEVRNELVSRGIPSIKIDFVRKEIIQSAELPYWLEMVC